MEWLRVGKEGGKVNGGWGEGLRLGKTGGKG